VCNIRENSGEETCNGEGRYTGLRPILDQQYYLYKTSLKQTLFIKFFKIKK
jgi:hypothetical protein